MLRLHSPVLAIIALLALLCTSDLIAQQPVTRENARFVASSQGRVYYAITCDNWRRLSRANLRWFRTSGDAEKAGYHPSTARGCAPQLDTALIQPTIGGSAQCTVARIIDGDTFLCEGGSRVRAILIDTDEIGQSAYADSATALVHRLMPPGSRVRLEFDIALYDRYRRILAYVYADSVFVNREIARRGLGHVAVYPPNVRMVGVMRAAADSARAERLGVWSGSAFECTPADYRAGKCKARPTSAIRDSSPAGISMSRARHVRRAESAIWSTNALTCGGVTSRQDMQERPSARQQCRSARGRSA